MARDEHAAAVEAAKQKIGEVQELLSAARERAEEAQNAVALATGGEQSNSPSGQGAFGRAARVPSIIDDAYATTAEVINELDAYLAGL
jgi:hypothetical protein